MVPGFATPIGTSRLAGRFLAQKEAGFYREPQGLSVSSIGIGTYLGDLDEVTDRGYVEAVQAALAAGVNLVDTSLNYRHQRSERSVGAALGQALEIGLVQRDEIVVCTKAGYLVPNAVPVGILSGVAGGVHCIAPAFLADQLVRSRQNLGLDTIDLFYLHNPETQLSHISQAEFYGQIRQAFTLLETAVAQNAIRYYGTATWDGYRRPSQSTEALSLERLARIAQEIAGQAHHFRFIQLPFNLAMTEAFVNRVDGESVLSAARRLGISVVASASLLQARLARNLPAEIRARLPGSETDAQCSIQFVRSTPGIAAALVGMSSLAHVQENLALAAVPPATEEQYLSLYQQS